MSNREALEYAYGEGVDDAMLELVKESFTEGYTDRIDDLKIYAAEEGESVNKDSESEFWEFIESNYVPIAADIVLIAEGNIRSVWQHEGGSWFAIHFTGNGTGIIVWKQQVGDKEYFSTWEAGLDTIKNYNIFGMIR